jgi:hypothetical protein
MMSPLPPPQSKIASMWGEEPQHPSIACWLNSSDSACINAKKLHVPPRTLVVVAHGNKSSGVTEHYSNDIDSYTFKSYTIAQVIKAVKLEMKLRGNEFDQVVFISCDVALKDNGRYMQQIANGLGLPVSSPTNNAYLLPGGGLTVANGGDVNNSGRISNGGKAGHFIKHFPNRPDYQVYSHCEMDSLHNCIPRD